MANNAMFNLHPPYLNVVTAYAVKVFLDQKGVEDTEVVARITMERDEDAQWFNPDIEDLSEWYEITIEENDITDDTILCQLKTT